MKTKYIGLGLALSMTFTALVTKAADFGIEDYNKTLIKNGVAWSSSQGTYLPSFYTGFAPRIEESNRIHLHLGRGNQIRLTAQLDEYSLLTYLYGLKKREGLFDQAIQQGLIRIQQQNQLDSYKQVIGSSRYKINSLIANLESGAMTREDFYKESLLVLEELNPGRVFHIKLNLTKNIERWKANVDTYMAGASAEASVSKNQQRNITLINDLVWGRINITFISPEIKAKLIETLNSRGDAGAFAKNAMELFKLATKDRYNFNVLRQGKLQSSIYADASNQIILEYPEFTAIYPNGSVKDYTKDRDGNRIPIIRENGVMSFIGRSSSAVDHIRSEPFYGYIPKMDYTSTGNGLHNPAVRTYLKSSVYKNLYQDLEIPKTNDTLWIVSRGGVSHGCTRMAAGHALEVRAIFPSNENRMTKVNYFGNASEDYDLYDIDGDGTIEVMGVQYYLAYAIAGDSGEGYREGAGLIPSSQNRTEFYNFLYGQKQFRMDNDTFKFINPYISQFAYDKGTDIRGKVFSLKIPGEFSLYEQKYEQDKMQFFKMSSSEMSTLQSESGDNSSLGKQMVRILGRASGCGPFKKEYALCNEDVFDKEFNKLSTQVTKVK